MSRAGACTACHQELPKENLATSFLHHVAKYTGQLPDDPHKHATLIHKIVLLAAWVQIGAVIIIPVMFIGCIVWFKKRKRNKKQA